MVSPYLVEPNIISEVDVVIQLLIAPVRSSSSLHIATKDVNYAVLNLFCNCDQVHVVPTPCGTFHLRKLRNDRKFTRETCYLKIVTIVLVEALQTLDEQKIRGKPCRLPKQLSFEKYSKYKLIHIWVHASSSFHQTFLISSPQANSRPRNVDRAHQYPKDVLDAASTDLK